MNKMQRALKFYNGHKGAATIAHVERNIQAAYPNAYNELTGVQYGKLMSVANTSFQDGKATAARCGEIWAYDNPTDWLAGIGPLTKSDSGGVKNAAVVTVASDRVTIDVDGKLVIYERVQ